MATNPAQPAVPQPSADAHHDEYTGVYGWFRRYQKLLLYTAGLFTLLTFSITGPMLALVGEIFNPAPPTASIAVGGQRVSLTRDDYHYGERIAQNIGTALSGVIPMLDAGEGGRTMLSSNIAILRRAAITEGIEVSMEEVDRAIDFQCSQVKTDRPSPAQLAVLKGFASLAEFRDVMREAMRVGNYIRLQTLALDGSDSLVIARLLQDKEKITFRAAVFDEKAAEEALKAKGGVSEEDLHKWLDGKTEQDKARFQAYDTNRLELMFGAALLAEGQFDPAQWADVLKDFNPTEDEQRIQYENEKESRWKLDGTGNYKPFEDVKAELLRLLQAEQVMKHLLGKVNERQTEALKPLNETLQRDQQDYGLAERAVKEARVKLEQSPDDAALKEELRKAEEVVPSKRAAIDAGVKAVQEARANWDFAAAWTDLTKDKTGFVLKPMKGRRNAEGLKDLDSEDLGLGQWALSVQSGAVQSKGDMPFQPIRTTKAVAIYRATDVEVRPLKPWDKLKPLAEGAYFAEKAKEEGETKKKTFEEALLRLAKAKMPEKVAEFEGKRSTRVDEKLAEWERTTQQGIADAERTLTGLPAGTQAQKAWQKKLETLRTELEGKDGKRTVLDLEVGKAIENEVAEEAKKHHRDVLDAAAAEAGFTVADHGPYVRELSSRPRFDKAYDPTVVFLFRNHSKLKEGESTGLVQDQTNRRWIFAVCTKVEPITVQDLTRREFEGSRTGNGFLSFATQQANLAYRQAFTQEALEKRYELEHVKGTQRDEKQRDEKK